MNLDTEGQTARDPVSCRSRWKVSGWDSAQSDWHPEAPRSYTNFQRRVEISRRVLGLLLWRCLKVAWKAEQMSSVWRSGLEKDEGRGWGFRSTGVNYSLKLRQEDAAGKQFMFPWMLPNIRDRCVPQRNSELPSTRGVLGTRHCWPGC